MTHQAMVLAAGFGTRLWPLTLDRAKPAVPLIGRPLLTHVLDWLHGFGVNNAVVNTSYQAQSVERAASVSAMPVAFSPEDKPIGTAGALGLARDRGLLRPDLDTIIANGKLYLELDLEAALRAHRVAGAAVTMVLRPNPTRAHFREVLVDEGRIVGFGEGRIPRGESPLSFTGIHIVSPEVLGEMQAELSDTIRDIYPKHIEARQVLGHIDDGRWWELSTPERYLEVHQQAWAEGLGKRRAGGNVCWPGSTIHPRAEVTDCILGTGVTLGPQVELNRCVVVKKELLTAGQTPPRPGYALDGLWVCPLEPTNGPAA